MGGDGGGVDGGGGELNGDGGGGGEGGGGGDGGGVRGHQLYSTGFQQAYWPGLSPVVR